MQPSEPPGPPAGLRPSSASARPVSLPVSGLHHPPGKPRLRRGTSFLKDLPISSAAPSAAPSAASASASASPAPSQAPLPRLRRGSTIMNPSSASASARHPSPAPVPRLRRGSTFLPTSNSNSNSNSIPNSHPPSTDDALPLPRLRRGSSIARPSTHIEPRRSVRLSASGPPRADTYAFGSPSKDHRTSMRRSSRISAPFPPSTLTTTTHATSVSTSASTAASAAPASTSVPAERRASTADKAAITQRTCGMCNSCGGSGVKGMPPWAPERLKTMSREERDIVLRELRMKEEMGRLEAELRRQRLEDTRAMGRRIERRRSSARGELVPESSSGHASHTSGDVSEEARPIGDDMRIDSEDLESVDLGDEPKKVRSQLRRRRSPTAAANGNGVSEVDDDISAPVGGQRPPKAVQDCGYCDGFEQKVNDLEEQLEVLKDVVKVCSRNEELSRKEEDEDDRSLKKNKSWMGKIAQAYYGNSAAAGERARLKEEVDELRKATDFLFQRLQMSSATKPNSTS